MAQRLVIFNSRDTLIRLDVSKIIYFEADGNYTYIVTANKLRFCVTMNLAHTEEALVAQLGSQAQRFMRVGKRFIVSIAYISKVDVQKQTLLLTDFVHFAYQLPVSKEALKSVKSLIINHKI